MSFSEAKTVLIDEPEAEAASDEENDAVEDDGDDFVARYMEDLLARNKEHAGTSLPEELSNPLVSEQSATVPQKQPWQPRSFLDTYISGEYNPDTYSATAVTEPYTPMPAELELTQPERQKINLNELRDNMDSFRQLSTRSVENALATHAQKQERGGLTVRKLVLICLILGSIVTAAAVVLNLIPFFVLYIAGGMTFMSMIELGFKFLSIRRRVKNMAEIITPEDTVGQTPTTPQTVVSDMPPKLIEAATPDTPEADPAEKFDAARSADATDDTLEAHADPDELIAMQSPEIDDHVSSEAWTESQQDSEHEDQQPELGPEDFHG